MYDYHIQAYNIAGFADFTGTSVQTLTTPRDAPAATANDKISLTWNAPFGAASYNIYRSTTPGGEGATPVATGITAASFVDNAVTGNTTYYYQITAVDSSGESARSSELSAKALYTGDLNGDGTVGFADLLALAQHYGATTGVTWAQGDLNGDGSVNFTDLLQLAQHYGAGSAAAPATAAAAASSIQPATDVTVLIRLAKSRNRVRVV